MSLGKNLGISTIILAGFGLVVNNGSTCAARLTSETVNHFGQQVERVEQLAQHNIPPDIFSRSNEVFKRQGLTSKRLCK